MLEQPIVVGGIRPITDRARRRAAAELFAPPRRRRRRGARSTSRARAKRRGLAAGQVVVVAVALLVGHMLSAPEIAREATAETRPGAVAPTGSAATTSDVRVTTLSAGTAAPDAPLGPASRAAAELVSRIADARSMAVKGKEPVTLVLDPGTGRLWLLAGFDLDAEPASAGRIRMERSIVLESPVPRPTFTFAEDGAAEADSVWVRDGRQNVLVTVDGQTGEPRASQR